MKSDNKTFAFRLADRNERPARWQARSGVSLAGCTHVGEGHYWNGPIWLRDGQYEC